MFWPPITLIGNSSLYSLGKKDLRIILGLLEIRFKKANSNHRRDVTI